MGYPSYNSAKESGCIRTEGRDYVLKPEDVVLGNGNQCILRITVFSLSVEFPTQRTARKN
eukprot:scaffold227528_cov24-Attheya_sp.AAC.1